VEGQQNVLQNLLMQLRKLWTMNQKFPSAILKMDLHYYVFTARLLFRHCYLVYETKLCEWSLKTLHNNDT
jgi:hypothetical protein